jgi:thioredoxin-dependent peroxiredoxin
MTTPKQRYVRLPEVGQPAPKFSLPAYPSGQISLDDFIGRKNVILAFYPKDDTPGCTAEMCAFSSQLDSFAAADTQVLGISCDSLESHHSFARKFSLKQPLLVDEDGLVGQAYGTVRIGRNLANRVLFVIDKQGIVRHVVEGIPDNVQLLELIYKL